MTQPVVKQQSEASISIPVQETARAILEAFAQPVRINSQSASITTIPQQQQVKSTSSATVQKSVSNIKQQSSSTNFQVPEGYILKQAQYLGQANPAKGLDIEFLQNLVNQHSKFADTHLEEIEYNAFVDPFTSNLFQDEIVEIDYGCIDAYTSALGSQLDPLNSKGAQNDLKVNSRILDGKFSSFVDNQLLLGNYIDAGYSFTSFDAFNQEYQNRSLNKTSSSFNINSSQADRSSSKILS